MERVERHLRRRLANGLRRKRTNLQSIVHD
jgi:hypothetical protein